MKKIIVKTLCVSSISSLLIFPHSLWRDPCGIACSASPQLTEISKNIVAEKPQLSEAEIKELATNVTVKIFNNSDRGSGVIIAKNGANYTVVTNAHVIKPEKTYQIETSDGKIYQTKIITRGNSLEGNDLAVLEFTAAQNYPVIPLSSKPNLAEKEAIYAGGFSLEDGKITINRVKISLIAPKPFLGGYQIGYNSEIKIGMSGGPLLNKKGELIGISGLQSYPVLNTAYNYLDGDKPSPEKIEEFRQFSFAVPIETLVLVAPNLAIIPSEWKTGDNVASKVDSIAREITVRIDLQNKVNGSGVIIARKGQTYYVVTNEHVLKNKDNYQIVTPDGEKYKIEAKDITLAKGFDGAIVKFSSSKNYKIATIGRYYLALNQRQWVIVSGFPATLNGRRKLTAGFRFNRERSLFEAKDDATYMDTNYQLIYTNISQHGMSGGPVLDAKGQLVGINAGTEAEGFIGYSVGVPNSNLFGLIAKKGIALDELNLVNNAPEKLSPGQEIALKKHPAFILEKPDNNADASAWFNYGNELWRLERFEEAIVALKKSIELGSGRSDGYLALGLVYASQNKHQLAVEQFDKVIKISPLNIQALREKSDSLSALEKYSEALEAIDLAIDVEENDFNLYLRLANILYFLGRLDEAIEAYTNSIQINPNFSAIYIDRGIVYYNQNEFDLALADWTHAIAINPNYAKAYYNRANLYKNQNKFDLALDDYTRAIAINPNYAKAYGNRGILYKDQNKFDLALDDYTRAIAINPNLATAYNNRANLYKDQNKFDLALDDYTRAIDINPNDAEVYYNCGILYYNQNKFFL